MADAHPVEERGGRGRYEKSVKIKLQTSMGKPEGQISEGTAIDLSLNVRVRTN